MKKHKQIQLGETVFLMLLYGVPIEAKDKKRPLCDEKITQYKLNVQ